MNYMGLFLGTRFGKVLMTTFLNFYAKKIVYAVDKYYKFLTVDIKNLNVRCDVCTMLNMFDREYASIDCIYCETPLNIRAIDHCIKYNDFINFRGYSNAKQ